MVLRSYFRQPIIILITALMVDTKLSFVEVALKDKDCGGNSLPTKPLTRNNFKREIPTCDLDIYNDFTEPQPIFLYNDKLLQPDFKTGVVRLQQNEYVTVACVGKNNYVTYAGDKAGRLFKKEKSNLVNITCVFDRTFIIHGVAREFKKIKCEQFPWFTMDKTDHTCFKDNKITRFGYYINKKLYLLYEVCFDEGSLSTIYSRHILRPSNYYYQNLTKPSYVGAVVYGTTKIKDIFGAKHQMSILEEQLGDGMYSPYLNASQFLTRAHLTPRADFSMINYQRTTFTYMNTAPQWFSVNKGEWLAIEKGLRHRIKEYGSEVIIYTGTFSVTTLWNKESDSAPIYLGKDEDGRRTVPVPMYFYKLIYDPVKYTALAIVTINAPFLHPYGLDMLQFCDNVCPNDERNRIKWIKWPHHTHNNTFCCNYQQFYNKIRHVQLHVKDIFV